MDEETQYQIENEKITKNEEIEKKEEDLLENSIEKENEKETKEEKVEIEENKEPNNEEKEILENGKENDGKTEEKDLKCEEEDKAKKDNSEKQEEEEEPQTEKQIVVDRITPNKVLDHLFIGNKDDCQNLQRLKELNITHIINLAVVAEVPNHFPDQFEYLSISLLDAPFSNITKHFEKCFEFIDKSKSKNGSTLVHCWAGLSRAATICVAYTMKHTGWTLKESYDHVFKCRGVIFPNEGFFNQLVEFEEKLYGKTTMQQRKMREELNIAAHTPEQKEALENASKEFKKKKGKKDSKKCWVQ